MWNKDFCCLYLKKISCICKKCDVKSWMRFVLVIIDRSVEVWVEYNCCSLSELVDIVVFVLKYN